MIDVAADFHTHTKFSHGSGTVEDNVKAAIDRGLAAIAISDHGMGHPFYGIRDLDAYIREIETMRAKYAPLIRIYSGYEGNLQSLNGRIDLNLEQAKRIDFPFFGYHKMVRYPKAGDFLHFMLPKSSSDSAIEKNDKAYAAALASNNVMMISHPGYGLPIDMAEVAKAAAANGVALEINAKHPEFSVEELRTAAAQGVRFIIGSDAHSPDRVGDFKAAVERAEEAGIPASLVLNSTENIAELLDRLEQRRAKRGPKPFKEVLGSAYREA